MPQVTDLPRLANNQRAKRAKAAMLDYEPEIEGQCAVIDLLTDLRHYCDREGLSFWDCDRIAHDHYTEELTGDDRGQAGNVEDGVSNPEAFAPLDDRPNDGELTRLRMFTQLTARLTKDQECSVCCSSEDENPDCEDHELFDMPNDDAVETLHSLISQARELTKSEAL